MPTPIEAYRQGYEKGRSDSAGGRLAEVTMGMLRDDPGGHFQKGYSDGAAGKPFSPPSIPQKSFTRGLVPKFSENPIGWFVGVAIVVECWVLWQLVKAPFQLLRSLMKSEKPSPWVIVKTVIAAGSVALALLVPHLNQTRGPVSYAQPAPMAQAPAPTQASPGPSYESLKNTTWACGGGAHNYFDLKFLPDLTFVLRDERDTEYQGRYSILTDRVSLQGASYIHDASGNLNGRRLTLSDSGSGGWSCDERPWRIRIPAPAPGAPPTLLGNWFCKGTNGMMTGIDFVSNSSAEWEFHGQHYSANYTANGGELGGGLNGKYRFVEAQATSFAREGQALILDGEITATLTGTTTTLACMRN